MATFLTLPPEIRTMIYVLVLDVRPAQLCPYRLSLDKENTRTTPRVKRTGIANLGILETCSFIKNEASQILYSRNIFLPSNASFTSKFFEKALHNYERRSWIKAIYLRLEPIMPRSFDCRRPPQTDFCRSQHQKLKNDLVLKEWPETVEFILDNFALDSLRINICVACCAHRCCPLQASLLATFSKGFAHGVPRVMSIDKPCVGGRYLFKDALGHDTRCLIETWTLQRRLARVTIKEGVELNGRLIELAEAELADLGGPLPYDGF